MIFTIIQLQLLPYNIECEKIVLEYFNPEYVENMTVTTYKYNRTTTAFNLFVKTVKEIPTLNVSFHVKFSLIENYCKLFRLLFKVTNFLAMNTNEWG